MLYLLVYHNGAHAREVFKSKIFLTRAGAVRALSSVQAGFVVDLEEGVVTAKKGTVAELVIGELLRDLRRGLCCQGDPAG